MKRKTGSIKYRIIIIFIAVTILQIAAVAFFALFQLRPHVSGIYEEHQIKMTDALLYRLNEIKSNIESYSVNIIGDSLVQDFLENKNKYTEETGFYGLPVELRNKVLSYVNYDNRIKGIYLIDNYGSIYSNAIDYSLSDYIEKKDSYLRQSGARALWFSDYREDDIVMCRIVNNNTTDLNRRIGALYIVMNRDIFLESIQQFMNPDEEQYILKITDGQLEIGNLKDEPDDLQKQNRYLIRQRNSGSCQITTWMDKEVVYKPVYDILKILFTELLLLLIFSICLIIFLSGRITKPLSDIKAVMGELGGGNIDARVPVSRNDEIGQLAKTMNRMAERIEDLVFKIKEDQKKQRMLELKSMQYQINPHFLYNTLDSVCMYARKNNDMQIAEMVTALSNYFRMSLSHGKEVITLKDEVRYALYYLEVQNIRFPNQIRWEIQIEEGLEELYILKFVLQPLIENSINHGIRNSENNGFIRISAFSRDNSVVIRVEDNGNGMLPEETEQLIKMIGQNESQNKDPFSGGFGMRNVHQRLKLYYGEESGLQISSIWEEGTTISMEIPKEAMQK